MPAIVTRPRAEALRWARRLQAEGIAAVVLPLIEIAPAPDPAAVAAAQDRLSSYDAVMFVSANAVRGLLQGAALPAGVRAWAPGPGTAEALVSAGVDARAIDGPAGSAAQFDSEALWKVVREQVRPGTRVLVVRGAGSDGVAAGRDWLTDRLTEADAKVDTVPAYARARPSWRADELARARAAAQDGSVWLFSSSEAVVNLGRLMPAQPWGHARALATHPRIAQAASAAGFGRVDTCRPAFEDVLASLQSAG